MNTGGHQIPYLQFQLAASWVCRASCMCPPYSPPPASEWRGMSLLCPCWAQNDCQKPRGLSWTSHNAIYKMWLLVFLKNKRLWGWMPVTYVGLMRSCTRGWGETSPISTDSHILGNPKLNPWVWRYAYKPITFFLKKEWYGNFHSTTLSVGCLGCGQGDERAHSVHDPVFLSSHTRTHWDRVISNNAVQCRGMRTCLICFNR